MADAGQVKAEVTVTYDGSGIEAAKKDLSSLNELGGDLGGGTDALNKSLDGLDVGLQKVAGSASEFGNAVGEVAKPLTTVTPAIAELTDGLNEGQKAIEGAGGSFEALNGPLGTTVEMLGEAPAPMAQIAQRAESLSPVIEEVGQHFETIGNNVGQVVQQLPQFADSLHEVSAAFDPKQFGLDQFAENMSVFQDAMSNPEPFNLVQAHLQETGQTWNDFFDSIGEGNANQFADTLANAMLPVNSGFEQANKSASAFNDNIQATQDAIGGWLGDTEGPNAFTERFNALGNAAKDASSEVEKFSLGSFLGSAKSQLFGGVDEAGNAIEGMFSFGGLIGGLSELAMPLFAVQMIGATVSQVGKAIYDAAAIAEGPGAHGFGTFTGAVDSLGYTAQQVGGSFSEAFGQQFTSTIGAVNDALGNNQGGLNAMGTVLGGAASLASNLLIGALGVPLLFTGIGTPLGATMIQAGMEGVANNIAAFTGQPPEFTGQQATPQMQINAQVQQGWSQIPTQVINDTAGNINNTNKILTEASDPGFIQAQNNLSHAQQYMQYQQQQFNAAHPYNRQTEALQSSNNYNTMNDQYAATHGPRYWSDAVQAAQQGNWFGPMGPNQSGGGFFSNLAQAFNLGPQIPLPFGNNTGSGGWLSQLWNQGSAQTASGNISPLSKGINSVMDGINNALGYLSPFSSNPMQSTSGWASRLVSGGGQGIGDFFGGLGNGFMKFWNPTNDSFTSSVGGGCFIAGTPVLMFDGTEKPIECLRIGELVLGSDGKNQFPVRIMATVQFAAKRTFKLTFSDGRTLTLTDSHPVYTPDGWKALSVAAAKIENPDLDVLPLQGGDLVYTLDGLRSVVSIENQPVQRVFNITVNGSHTYYANRVLVHNKGMGMTSSGVGTEQTQLSHTFTANVTWAATGLEKNFQAVASWVASGLQHAFQAVAQWAASGLQHAFQAVAQWAASGLEHAFQAVAQWAASGLEHAFQAVAEWTAENLIKPFQAVAEWTGQNLIKPFVAIAEWAGQGLTRAFTAVASWIGQNLMHTFVGVAQWIGQGLTHVFQATASFLGVPGFASGVQNFAGGPAFIAENGPELVMLPNGSSVFPLTTNSAPSANTGLSMLGGMMGGGGNGPSSVNLSIHLDSQTLLQQLGVPLASNIRVGMGLRS